MEINIAEKDEIIMRLVHYFVTKENYQPILVTGVDNEIWLENVEKKYSVIRITSNYIHNNEQLDYDLYKSKSIIKQIKKKTLSLKMDTLSILLNIGDNVSLDSTKDKHISYCTITDPLKIENNNTIISLFPDLKDDIIEGNDVMDFFINVTNDINKTTEKKNKLFERTFRKKKIIVTNLLIILNVIVYALSMVGILNPVDFAMNADYFKAGEYYRIITSAFFHGSIVHLLCNMYSLYVIGTQLETVLGKIKYIIVYIISILSSSLLSAVLNGSGVVSIGASGAIFGLMGALLYFGYHYRLYLGSVITSQLLPVIAINLVIGFTLPYIDNFAHIGGLIGGLFGGMMVGIEERTEKRDTINGIIVTIILFAFLIYMLFR